MPGYDLDCLGAVGSGIGPTIKIAFIRSGIEPAEKHLRCFAMESGGSFEVAVRALKLVCLSLQSKKIGAASAASGWQSAQRRSPATDSTKSKAAPTGRLAILSDKAAGGSG